MYAVRTVKGGGLFMREVVQYYGPNSLSYGFYQWHSPESIRDCALLDSIEKAEELADLVKKDFAKQGPLVIEEIVREYEI